jgi:chorismate synthase
MSSSLGKIFRITTFGESHGYCIGVVVDGCPAGQVIDLENIQGELDRRRPGQSKVTTSRDEPDRVEVLSGSMNGRATGAPICMIIKNKDSDSTSYEELRSTPRPGHADYTSEVRYGGYQDYRGGGRFSGRNTAALVMAGALARQVLAKRGVEVHAYTSQIGQVVSSNVSYDGIKKLVDTNIVRCPDPKAANKMIKTIEEARKEGDSVGGKVTCVALNVPAGVGEPFFDTLEGELAKALFSVPAVKAVEFGAGTMLASMRGSESNDPYVMKNGRVETESNNSGGVQGGISNGMPVTFKVTFKPTPSIAKTQRTVDLANRTETIIQVKGRHDPCIVPRAVPVVESVAAVVLLDHMMRRGYTGKVAGEQLEL